MAEAAAACIRPLALGVLSLLLAVPAVPLDTSRCPVQILDVQDGDAGSPAESLQLSEEGLQYLEGLPSPIHMVPVLGVYRGGKSLLMNRIMGLQAPYAGGFGVGHGQHTFTRGIYACAERVQGLGTVVWMDTEGLFSHQDARAAYGPKIFTLALLFSSSVLLNNVKVLNDQFFGFFSEQQQIARMLKKGLTDAGLPEEQLLSRNLHITWVVQQPVQYGGRGGSASERSRSQLEKFLAVRGDEARNRVRTDYQHDIFEVPVAIMDDRLWRQLDQMPDERLNPDYVGAAQRLREAVLGHLRSARPLQAAGLGEQLRMFVQAVRTEQFSGTLAREAFEATTLGTLCGNYSQAIADLAGELPTQSVETAIEQAAGEAEQRRLTAVEEYHLSESWSARLERCLEVEADALRRRNEELILSRWESAVGTLAERGECFFMGEVAGLATEFSETFGDTFSYGAYAKGHDYAAALQSTRLAECVRLTDLVWPFAPWFVWPILQPYMKDGMSGFISLLLHAVAVAGLYAMLQSFGHLPTYLDSEYPVLRFCPGLLSWVLFLPSFPWSGCARVLGILGAMHSAIRFLVALPRLCRPVGDTVGQLVNLELKINMILQRTNEILKEQQQATARQQLISAALGLAANGSCGESCAGTVELLKGLSVAVELSKDGGPLQKTVGRSLQRRASAALLRFDPSVVARGFCRQFDARDVMGCALRGELQQLVEHMVAITENALVDGAEASEGSEEGEEGEEDEEDEQASGTALTEAGSQKQGHDKKAGEDGEKDSEVSEEGDEDNKDEEEAAPESGAGLAEVGTERKERKSSREEEDEDEGEEDREDEDDPEEEGDGAEERVPASRQALVQKSAGHKKQRGSQKEKEQKAEEDEEDERAAEEADKLEGGTDDAAEAEEQDAHAPKKKVLAKKHAGQRRHAKRDGSKTKQKPSGEEDEGDAEDGAASLFEQDNKGEDSQEDGLELNETAPKDKEGALDERSTTATMTDDEMDKVIEKLDDDLRGISAKVPDGDEDSAGKKTEKAEKAGVAAKAPAPPKDPTTILEEGGDPFSTAEAVASIRRVVRTKSH
uniref:Guanylate-binding protein N-terminal domain-containing protein n=1 Tax=Alexandrium monilatum TaxID=311494 RepID=A0A7S4V7Q1_9DINO